MSFEVTQELLRGYFQPPPEKPPPEKKPEPKKPPPPKEVKKKDEDEIGWIEWLGLNNLDDSSIFHFFSHLIREYIPNYLASLPIPESIGGWFRLGIIDWLRLIPPTVLGVCIIWLLRNSVRIYKNAHSRGKINFDIEKRSRKVVNTIEIDIHDQDSDIEFCRCWRTHNWPYCDGSHEHHNDVTGDNVGPFMVVRRKPKPTRLRSTMGSIYTWLCVFCIMI